MYFTLLIKSQMNTHHIHIPACHPEHRVNVILLHGEMAITWFYQHYHQIEETIELHLTYMTVRVDAVNI